MDRGFTVLNITFITASHHMKWQFVAVMAWQAIACHTDGSNTNFSNKLLANFFLCELQRFFIIKKKKLSFGLLNFKLTRFYCIIKHLALILSVIILYLMFFLSLVVHAPWWYKYGVTFLSKHDVSIEWLNMCFVMLKLLIFLCGHVVSVNFLN
jgi:hypothetical protein